jgi:hypothetical protein
MDNTVRDFTDSLDRRLHRVSCCWGADPSAIGIRSHLSDFAFRLGNSKGRLSVKCFGETISNVLTVR